MLDFNDYRTYNDYPSRQYCPEYVEKNFYKALSTLGPLNKDDYFAFITIRLKSNSDRCLCEGVIAGLAFKISSFYWKNITKHRLLPFVGSVESVERKTTIKDHIHMIIRFKEPKKHYEPEELERKILSIASGFEEINKNDKGAVKTSIFQYASASKELGNKVHYLCKTSSKNYEPLVFHLIKRKQIKQRLRTAL